MNHLINLIVIFFIISSFFAIPKSLEAQSNIPIIGADESLSQYICITTPGVKTLGMKVISANGQVKNITVKTAKAQVDKQIDGFTKRILAASALAAEAESAANREKLKAKVKVLRTQRESLKYIKTQIALCAKAKLEFNLSTVPVLLTNTTTNAAFQYPVNLFMFGFKFTVPKIYKGQNYCVKVTNASSSAPNLGAYLYPENSEYTITANKNCLEFGAPIGQLCVNGLEADEAMIPITQGAVIEREGQGNCSSISTCPLNELRSVLSNFYANTRLASFRPGDCN